MPPVLFARTIEVAVALPAVLTAEVAWMVTLAVGNTMYTPAGMTLPTVVAGVVVIWKYAPGVLATALARIILLRANAILNSPYSDK